MRQIRIMTVCTGNICRSPMAESILRHAFAAAGWEDRVVIDSTAITREEIGSRIDRRAATALTVAGYDPLPSHRAREVRAEDLRNRDLVLPMTRHHARYLRRILPPGTPGGAQIRMYRTFDPIIGAPASTWDEDRADWDIADPWYGGPEDFVTTLRQVEAGAAGIVEFARGLAGQRADS